MRRDGKNKPFGTRKTPRMSIFSFLLGLHGEVRCKVIHPERNWKAIFSILLPF